MHGCHHHQWSPSENKMLVMMLVSLLCWSPNAAAGNVTRTMSVSLHPPTAPIDTSGYNVDNERPRRVLTLSSTTIADATEAAQVSTMLSALAGAPLTATHAARTTVILPRVSCQDHPNEEEPLPFTHHPGRLSFGSGPNGQHMAAVILNILIIVLFSLLHFAVSRLVAGRSSKVGPRRSYAMLRFPSLQFVFVMALLQPLASSSTFLFRHGANATHYIAGVVGIGSIVSYVVALFYATKLAFAARYKANGVTSQPPPSAMRTFFFGRGHWVDRRFKQRPITEEDKRKKEGQWKHSKPLHFVGMYGFFFEPLQEDRQWFSIVEVVVTAACGVVDGFGRVGDWCAVLAAVMAGVFLLYFVALLILRPYASMYNTICCFSMSLMQVVAVLLIGGYHLSESTVVVVGAEWLSLLAMNGSVFKAIVDIGSMVFGIAGRLCSHKPNDTQASDEAHVSDHTETEEDQDVDQQDGVLHVPGGEGGVEEGSHDAPLLAPAAAKPRLPHSRGGKAQLQHATRSEVSDDAKPFPRLNATPFDGLPTPWSNSDDSSRQYLGNDGGEEKVTAPTNIPLRYTVNAAAMKKANTVVLEDEDGAPVHIYIDQVEDLEVRTKIANGRKKKKHSPASLSSHQRSPSPLLDPYDFSDLPQPQHRKSSREVQVTEKTRSGDRPDEFYSSPSPKSHTDSTSPKRHRPSTADAILQDEGVFDDLPQPWVRQQF